LLFTGPGKRRNLQRLADTDRDLKRPQVVRTESGALAELLNLAFDAIFVRTFRDRTITYWNRGAEELYGYTPLDALGKNPAQLLRSVYPIPLEEIEWELLATGRWEGDIIHTHSSGSTVTVASRWVLRRDAGGEPVEILEINSDITREKAANEQLRRSEQRFRMLVDNVSEYAIFMLDPRGVISSWNAGARRIKGYESSEIIGKHFSVFYPREDVLAGKPQWELEMARSHGAWEDEGWRIRKDGSRFWANVVITALFDDSGVLTGYAKVTRDLTARREEEERLRQHADRMAELEAAKSNFLNLASHELRGPLTVVRGYLSMFAEGSLGQLSDTGREVVLILGQKVEEMAHLIEQMLDVARLEEGRLMLNLLETDIREVLLKEIESARQTVTEPALRIKPKLPREPVVARVDRSRLHTILLNLLSNAIKYSPDGGLVTVQLNASPSELEIVISDHGVGIQPEDLPQLFSRFGRIVTPATSAIPGVGLGLYLSRELARMHGGDLEAESEPGQGSTFTLKLPR
jgi:PAS domain S-box-containing protein